MRHIAVHAITRCVTVAGANIAGATAAGDAARDWAAVRHMPAIQYAPLPPVPMPTRSTPAWLEALMRFLESVFGPIGHLLGMSWPTFRIILIVAAVALALYVLWQIARVFLARHGRTNSQDTPEWVPDRGEAEALLSDADRLADEGRYAQAVHLLLRRSVQHIRAARPDWLRPASTAREIAVLDGLPEAGRHAFAEMAARVERSRYALRELNAQDWQAARAAYAQFARVELRA